MLSPLKPLGKQIWYQFIIQRYPKAQDFIKLQANSKVVLRNTILYETGRELVYANVKRFPAENIGIALGAISTPIPAGVGLGVYGGLNPGILGTTPCCAGWFCCCIGFLGGITLGALVGRMIGLCCTSCVERRYDRIDVQIEEKNIKNINTYGDVITVIPVELRK